MRVDFELTMRVLRALDQTGVAYKVIGGVAMNLHGLARATRDLGIFVRPDPGNVARLVSALKDVFDDDDLDTIDAGDLAGPYPAIQYVPPGAAFHVDILARLGDAFAYEDIETEERVVDGIRIPVASASMLYRMKCDTVRPRDRLDAEWLRSHSDIGGE